jgi:replicative DNA helicase
LNFCFVPIVQIGRQNEHEKKFTNRRPKLADLRGSGAWENDSDAVFLLYREAYYDHTIELDIVDIALAKQRGGPVADFKKLFKKEIVTIEDYTDSSGSYEEMPPE